MTFSLGGITSEWPDPFELGESTVIQFVKKSEVDPAVLVNVVSIASYG